MLQIMYFFDTEEKHITQTQRVSRSRRRISPTLKFKMGNNSKSFLTMMVVVVGGGGGVEEVTVVVI